MMKKNKNTTSLISALLVLGISAAAAGAVTLVKKLSGDNIKAQGEALDPEDTEIAEEEAGLPPIEKEDNAAEEAETTPQETPSAEDALSDGVTVISQEEAKKLMDAESAYVILDVRTKEEYREGHIPASKLIPDTELEARAAAELPDQDQLILVYCRSGRRSHAAAKLLTDLGYSNVKDFGGIMTWPYAIAR